MKQMILYRIYTCLILLTFLGASCKRTITYANPITPGAKPERTYIETDKAVYSPGETVQFTLEELPQNAKVRYWHLATILKEEAVRSVQWQWLPPADDFKGYLVQLYTGTGTDEKTIASIAVDVSSNGIHFPRNGFLSYYGNLDPGRMKSVIQNLNRHHINIVQFQDWEYKHHKPLAGDVTNPSEDWLDIAMRRNFKKTVQGYIALAHGYNMKTLSYNLAFGALQDAAFDGVKDEWYMYQDKAHQKKEVFPLPKPPFKSDIYFTDPSNTGWQNYIGEETKKAFEVYPFDGYQVDQVGNRNKDLYTYSGELLNLERTYLPFLESMKTQMPDKLLVMNAVTQYGQKESIAKSPVEFLYTEVWTPFNGYKDLADIIQDNDRWSDYKKKSVLCAYMNYGIADKPGEFNTPGVLLTNAVIYSFGGSHLELGEHMLGREYFPNNNLKMKMDLKEAMITYYDFLTGYENLLRDGGSFNNVSVQCTNNKINIGAWPPQSGKVSSHAKKVGERQVIHLINLAEAKTFEWVDADGTQPEPKLKESINLEIKYSGNVTKVWAASPDDSFGVPQNLPFTKSGDVIRVTLPRLKYWSMIVIE